MARFSKGWRLLPGAVMALGLHLWLASPMEAWAESAEDPCFHRNYALNVLLENDLWGSGSDKHFTHGSRISLAESREKMPDSKSCEPGERVSGGLDFIRNLLDPVLGKNSDLEINQVSLILGQSIFTPENISATTLVLNDRPYAGWLYFGVGWILPKKSGDIWTFDTVEIDLGIVGPQAYAGEVQRWVHEDVTDSPRPEGWANQLKNEPGLMISLERKWRMELTPKNYEGLQVDVLPSAGAALGNVFTYGAAGLMFRLGVNLPADYGPPRIRPGAQGSDYFKATREKAISWYVYGGVEGRAVAHNIFLDGNTFTDSHSVDRKILVGDVHAGAVLMIYRFRLAFSQVFRTPEFDGQREASEFGSISLSVAW